MKQNKITIGCDHAGYELKKKVIEHLQERGIEVIDVGTHSTDSCDYPAIAHAVCKNIQDGVTELGILVCGTGIGENKSMVEGITAEDVRAMACEVFNREKISILRYI